MHARVGVPRADPTWSPPPWQFNLNAYLDVTRPRVEEFEVAIGVQNHPLDSVKIRISLLFLQASWPSVEILFWGAIQSSLFDQDNGKKGSYMDAQCQPARALSLY